jgi:hypothetical protein
VNANKKQTFLVASDYGMGATWLLIDARRPDEIEDAYPELRVVHNRPAWLTDERWTQMDREAHFDIDAQPTGFLAALIAEREPEGVSD